MHSLKDIAALEKDNLTKLKRLEDKALFFTSSELSKAIKAAFKSDLDTIKSRDITTFSETYTASMMVSWLLGQYHVLKSVDENIELSSAPIYLAVEPIPFQEAIDSLKAMIPTDSWEYRQTEAAVKLRSFTIANVSGGEAINRVKKLYTQALEDGASKSETLQKLDGFMEQAGIAQANPYWLELHYRNNMMTAYNSGRWTQVANNDLVQYLVYSSVMDAGTTELCRHLDDVAKPKDDPFWEIYYPPNHHKCRGTVSPMSEKQFNALPSSSRKKSASVDNTQIAGSDTMSKEHQFKSSPVVALKSIPRSLMKEAKEFGLVESILEHSSKQSKKELQEQISRASQLAIPIKPLKEAIDDTPKLNPYYEMISERLIADSDEVLFGFTEDSAASGDFIPSLQFILHLDDELAAMAHVAAFDSEQVYRIDAVSRADLKEGEHIAVNTKE
ncbi:phage minor head protein [Enterovibrio nigricans]|uniref:Phage putative head morphogenesis protein, SPP1 gp7 family n=1 Tax=Enterovibrio nigricans DSM 22720 TaxID=1121868 RepID=A0A1T4UVF4_9GAMM|nr:phage minor head protein [Enterovibrio nigricans]SKA56672.1 phage putative head morphogenesis protein, SPP1 gp7 family [Enterovibrio nigricans DSM 22720]